MTDTKETISYQRLFIALRPGEEAVRSLRRLCAQLKKSGELETVRWMRPENLHITLAFLGQQTAGQVANTIDVMQQVAEGHNPFDVVIGGPSIMHNNWQKGVLVARVRESAALMHLQHDLVLGLRKSKVQGLDEREFKPHVTLARFKSKILPPERLEGKDWSFAEHISEMSLYNSVTLETGAVYTKLHTARFGIQN